MIAVGFYLLSVVPLLAIVLLEVGVLAQDRGSEARLKMHVPFVAIFLVVSHVAMISGMLSPAVFAARKMT